MGLTLGYHWAYTLLFIAAPVMAGGQRMGALPMSEMYAAQLGTGAEQYLSVMMSGVVIANTLYILLAALLNGIGKRSGQRFLGFNDAGQLLRIQDDSMAGEIHHDRGRDLHPLRRRAGAVPDHIDGAAAPGLDAVIVANHTSDPWATWSTSSTAPS